MNENLEYEYLCRKCESFYHSHDPQESCPNCKSDEDVLLLKVKENGKWESFVTNSDIGYVRLAHILRTFETQEDVESPELR